MSSTTRVTVSLPAELAKEMPGTGKRSSFIIEAIREKVERGRQAEITASLSCLAFDDDANDISDFKPAQSKVMSRGD